MEEETPRWSPLGVDLVVRSVELLLRDSCEFDADANGQLPLSLGNPAWVHIILIWVKGFSSSLLRTARLPPTTRPNVRTFPPGSAFPDLGGWCAAKVERPTAGQGLGTRRDPM